VVAPYSGARVVTSFTAELGEGPRWNEDTGELWWVDLRRGALHRTEVESGATTTTNFVEPVSFVIPVGQDVMLVGLRHSVGTVKAGRDEITVLIAVGDDPDVVVNDAKVAPNGDLWLTTRSISRRPKGALHRLRADGALDTIVEGLVIGNGMAWSPDGQRFYLVDTATGMVDTFAVDQTRGLRDRRSFAVVPPPIAPAIGGPDGMAVDKEGGVWVACFGASALHHYAPDGTLVDVVTVPARAPTSCAFGGPKLDVLFVTTAALVVAPEDRVDRPFDGALLALDVAVGGLPEPRAHPRLVAIGRLC
jgi:sugar lactone lactonase YvrE